MQHASPSDAQRRQGAIVYQMVLFLCAGTAFALIARGLATSTVSQSVDIAILLQLLAGLAFLTISVAATTKGSRTVEWDLGVADIVYGVAKGLALVLVATSSQPNQSSVRWPIIAAAYTAAVSCHLGHVRRVMVGAGVPYRVHLRSAQHATAALTAILLVCFAASQIVAPGASTLLAPVIAIAFGVMGLHREASVQRDAAAS